MGPMGHLSTSETAGKIVKIVLSFACFLVSAGGLNSCTTTSGAIGDGSTIVERSKESPPSWTVQKSNILNVTEGTEFYSFVFFRDRLLNLPLGIKQAQISALDVSQRALEEVLKSQILNMVRDKPIRSRLQTAEFDRLVGETVKQYHAQNAKVQDMYFEKVSHDVPLDEGNIRESFRVFVLVTIASKGVPGLVANLGRRLLASGDAGLRSLGLILRQEQKQMSTH